METLPWLAVDGLHSVRLLFPVQQESWIDASLPTYASQAWRWGQRTHHYTVFAEQTRMSVSVEQAMLDS